MPTPPPLTQNDVFNRLKSLLPPWFGDTAPNLDVFINSGSATAFTFIYNFYVYAHLQTRIKTATGDFLDLISADFFGTQLPRKPFENDNSFRNRILSRLLQQKATLYGMINALFKLTGRMPIVYEPRRAGGFYGANSFYRYTTYGSGLFPYQAWIIAYRPSVIVNNPDYYNGNKSFYGAASYYGDSMNNVVVVTDQDILDLIEDVKPIGTLMHVTITD